MHLNTMLSNANSLSYVVFYFCITHSVWRGGSGDFYVEMPHRKWRNHCRLDNSGGRAERIGIPLPPQHGVARSERFAAEERIPWEGNTRRPGFHLPPETHDQWYSGHFSPSPRKVRLFEKMANESPAKSLVDIDLASLRVSAADLSPCYFLPFFWSSFIKRLLSKQPGFSSDNIRNFQPVFRVCDGQEELKMTVKHIEVLPVSAFPLFEM